jgi:transposase-like protein
MNFNKQCKCGSSNFYEYLTYTTKNNGDRTLFKCRTCGLYFSETYQSFMYNIKTSISKIALVLNSRTEGMSFNSTCRTHHISTHTLQDWENKFGCIKDALLLYSLTHTFVELFIEGDELYTKVNKNVPPSESEGWTLSLMDRASRFIWDLTCDKKEEELFLNAMEQLAEVIECTDDLTLLTDGERRYSALLFEICHELLRTGKPGRPKKVLPKGVKIKLKNKGDQSHKKGPKRKKYQTPKPEHPDTEQNIEDSDIHANHQEGQNAAYRRKNSAYRRRTNTYAKCKNGLQRTLDLYWVIHNFVRRHFSTKKVPAVDIGILKQEITLEEIMMNLKVESWA